MPCRFLVQLLELFICLIFEELADMSQDRVDGLSLGIFLQALVHIFWAHSPLGQINVTYQIIQRNSFRQVSIKAVLV